MISNGMIIQRNASFPIWSEKKTIITFLGKKYESQNINGKWLINLDPVYEADGPFTMELSTDEGTETIRDIYAGDVWLCAGQSNMEMDMERLRNVYPEEWCPSAEASGKNEFSLIHHFKVPQGWDFKNEREKIEGGKWIASSPETLGEFSAAAWFFAKNMQKKLLDTEGKIVPIGLVNTAWGGTPIESWMSRKALAEFPEKIEEADKYADALYCEKLNNETTAKIQEWENRVKNLDAGLKENWQEEKTDISSWKNINVPGDFSGAGLENFCGAMWLARDFELDAEFAANGADLHLGTIVDADTVFINGIETGNTTYRYPPRNYKVNASLLKQGKNRIAIRVICNNGEGGITNDKPFRIFSKSASLDLCGTWKYKVGTSVPDFRPSEFFFQWQPVGPYNAMIAPVLKFPLKGVIYYQGESNESKPHEYAHLFKNMIQDWRKKNGNKELPFVFVQLPIFGEPSENRENDSWALLREAQAEAQSLPAAAMACALELGEWNDIHPINKKDVGYRLFLAAEKILFKTENTSPGPVYRSHLFNKNKLIIFFNNCGSGLKTISHKDTKAQSYVSVLTNDKQERLPADIIETNCIFVDLSVLKQPAKKVLYAWANNPIDRQLFNSEGLPAVPFRFDICEGGNNV